MPGETVEAAISVPANASSAQRLLTLDAFVAAGFHVVALLNEPSAAGLEYAHRYRSTITAKREYVLIYDLGGGTFDASLLKMTGQVNEVVVSEGIQRLGGDDFDDAIMQLVLARSELTSDALAADARDLLREECAARKEAVGPQTRRFLVDLTAIDDRERPPFSCPIDDVYAVCAPLVDQTTELLDRVLRDPTGATSAPRSVRWSEVAGIYVVGGTGGFPLVSRILRTTFGERRVKRSPHPFAATAIGLAVFLDTTSGFALSERFSRHFGVFREARAGDDVVFDPIVPKDASLPADGQFSAGRQPDATGPRTTSAISASWSAADWSTDVPTATWCPTIRCYSRSTRRCTTARISGANRSAAGAMDRRLRSATSSPPAAPWK